jgi:microcystin-dependent protein
MANYEATRYDFDGANLTGIEGVNTGIVVPWGSAAIPSGFLLCDGTSYATASYTALFAVIAYTYGGSGANFNVPDLRDRTIVGVSSANSKTLAQSIGANTVTPTGNVGGNAASTTLATTQIASHTHSTPTGLAGPASQAGLAGRCMQCGQSTSSTSGSTGGGQGHTHTLSATFTGSANSVLQPGLVLNYIIKT